MPHFEHPLQLFSLEYPLGWNPRYQEDTGAVMFVHTGDSSACALCLSPVGVAGGLAVAAGLPAEVAQAARRLGICATPEAVREETWGDLSTGYVEGIGARSEDVPDGLPVRLWVVRRGPVALYVSHVGPGADEEEVRELADAAVQSLRFPEILPPSPDEFRERVMEVLQREYPRFEATSNDEWSITLSDREAELTTTVSLDNLYRTCLLNAESTGAIIRNYLDQLLDSLGAHEAYDQYDTVRGRLLPMLKPADWAREISERLELVGVEFAPGLTMCFAIDEPTRVAYVTRELLEKWDIPVERLQEVAQDNLASRAGDLSLTMLPGADGRPVALVVNTQDGYDAARLVLPGLRDLFATELGDEYLVGLPNRDFLIAFSQRDPEMQAGIVRQIQQDYHKMNHPLTPTIYRVHADSIEATDL